MKKTSATGIVLSCLMAMSASLLACGATVGAEVDPMDWPYWARTGTERYFAREVGLISEWDIRSGENVLWHNEHAPGRSTPIVMNGRVYTSVRDEPGTAREGEKVVCLDAETGSILWENRFNVYLSDVPDTRVGWANVTGDPETDRVYALGVCGLFQCIDAETGKTVWSRSLHEEFGLLSTYGGRTNTPIIVDDLVIVSAVIIGWGDMAKPSHAFLALNKNTGEVVWFKGTTPLPEDTTYSTPMVSVIGDQLQMVFGSGDGKVWGFQPRTGESIWSYHLSRRGLNVSPIVVNGQTVYTNQGEENIDDTTMGAVLALDVLGKKGDITKTGEKWRNKQVMAGKSSPLYWNGKLYVADDRSSLWVYDAETGEEIERQRMVGSMMHASPVYADGKIYACSTSGWNVFEINEDGTLKLAERMRMPTGTEVLGTLSISHGRIYLPTTSGIYCLGTEGQEPKVLPQPKQAQEHPVEAAPKPAFVQIVPAEVLIKPGESVDFTARLFNARGQLLGEAKDVTFEVDGPASIDSTGKLTAHKQAAHKGAYVTAKVGDLTGQARVRIVPDLPWKFDFEDGEIPITWVGARYRHKLGKDDSGNSYMIKRNDIPKGTRSQAWMGPIDLKEYTIQADVQGTKMEDQLPDIGLINQRYTLDLMGNSQQLQIRTWPPQLRMAQTVPFKWEPGVWYTMKFRSELKDDKALLYGKVWPRDQKEPEEWTVKAEDEVPNEQGSPGLFGNAKVAELYLDNIEITPNK